MRAITIGGADTRTIPNPILRDYCIVSGSISFKATKSTLSTLEKGKEMVPKYLAILSNGKVVAEFQEHKEGVEWVKQENDNVVPEETCNLYQVTLV